MSRARSENFKLTNMRLSFPNLFTPQEMTGDNGQKTKKYNCTLLWPKSVALTGIKADGTELDVMTEAVRVATEEWGDKAIEFIKSEIIKSPRLDGDGKQGVNKNTGARHAGYEGHYFLRASATEQYPPEMYSDKLGADNKLVKLTDPKALYPGCYVHAVVNLFAWENAKGGKGLSFGLSMIQFAKDGDRLGGDGGAKPDAFFQGVKGASAGKAADGGGASNLFA